MEATHLGALNELMVGVVGLRAADETLDAIADAIVSLLGCDMAGVALYDPVRDELRFPVEYGHRGFSRSFVEQFQLPADRGAGRKAFAEGRITVIPDTRAEDAVIDRVQAERAGIRAMLVGVLQTPEHKLGVLYANQRRPYAFSQEDVAFFSILAGVAAVAIDNARLYERIQARSRELEAFAYAVSHDLRAPLRAMQGFSHALLEDYLDGLDPVGQNYARRIMASAQEMDSLIQDLLAYSRLSRVELPVQPVALATVLEDVLGQLETEIREREARVSVEEPLPRVLGHQATVIQLVQNLVRNAIKFVAPGVKPRVRVRAEERDAYVRLWVEDNGIGISPESRERIFDVFERLHGVEAYAGTGIGLAIVRKGAERLGGRAGVESKLGRGSRFWVDLPISERPDVIRDA